MQIFLENQTSQDIDIDFFKQISCDITNKDIEPIESQYSLSYNFEAILSQCVIILT